MHEIKQKSFLPLAKQKSFDISCFFERTPVENRVPFQTFHDENTFQKRLIFAMNVAFFSWSFFTNAILHIPATKAKEGSLFKTFIIKQLEL